MTSKQKGNGGSRAGASSLEDQKEILAISRSSPENTHSDLK